MQSVKPGIITHLNLKARVSLKHATMDDGTIVPPPSPQLLALHAACAQVAHMSAAAGHLDDIIGDPDADHASVMTQPEATAILAQRLKALELDPSAA